MFPEVILEPASSAELVTLVVLAALALMTTAPFSRRVGDARLLSLFATYLAALLAASLAVHATFGSAPLVLRTYGVAMACGFVLAWLLAFRRLRSIGTRLPTVAWLLGGAVVVGLAGGRALWAIERLAIGESISMAELLGSDGGVSVLGGIVAYVGFAALLHRRRLARLPETLDAGVTAAALLVACSRVGCLLAGCCHGGIAPESGPLTIAVERFAPSSPAGLAYREEPGRSLWATQPLEAIGVLVIAGACEWLYCKRKPMHLPGGTVTIAALAGYAVLRLAIDPLKARVPALLGDLGGWQLASFVLVPALGLALLRARRARGAG
jgi:phosphatidylglycerol:prolipoprotein diacylglycerol transferase